MDYSCIHTHICTHVYTCTVLMAALVNFCHTDKTDYEGEKMLEFMNILKLLKLM